MAGVGHTFICLALAVVAVILLETGAVVATDQLGAVGAMETGGGVALVYVCLTQLTCVT